jgi:hypothetical protein
LFEMSDELVQHLQAIIDEAFDHSGQETVARN